MKFGRLLLLSLVVLAGCTIAPKMVIPKSPSPDPYTGKSDSGIICQLPDKSLVVSPFVMAKFAALCPLYGSKCLPPCPEPWGFTKTPTNTFVLQETAAKQYLFMSLLWDSNQKP